MTEGEVVALVLGVCALGVVLVVKLLRGQERARPTPLPRIAEQPPSSPPIAEPPAADYIGTWAPEPPEEAQASDAALTIEQRGRPVPPSVICEAAALSPELADTLSGMTLDPDGSPESVTELGTIERGGVRYRVTLRQRDVPEEGEAAESERIGYIDGIKGWRLTATLNLRTPLQWLKRDGEEFGPVRQTILPAVDSRFAYWAAIPKTRADIHRELGLPGEVPQDWSPARDRASFAGAVEADGGLALKFLIGFREIVEGPGSVAERCRLARAHCERPAFERLRQGMGAEPWERWAIDAIDDALPIGEEISRRLFQAGFHDLDAIRGATNEQLRAIDGIGPKRLKGIREALAFAANKAASEPPNPADPQPMTIGIGSPWRDEDAQRMQSNVEVIDSLGEPVVKHWRYEATLSRHTPLAVLEHHGETRPVGSELPRFGDRSEGIWVGETESWEEFFAKRGKRIIRKGNARRKMRASPIGTIDEDSAEHLHAFLCCYRSIVESDAPTADRVARMDSLWKAPEHALILQDVPSSWRTDWLVEELDALLGIGPNLCARLVHFKLWDADALRVASDERLLGLEGIGAGRLATIRNALDRLERKLHAERQP